MNVYIYQDTLYCEQCGEKLQQMLGFAVQGPYPDGGGEADHPRHCAKGVECFNSILFANGNVIGAWLENSLTSVGVEYVQRAIQEGGQVAELWADCYRDVLQEAASPLFVGKCACEGPGVFCSGVPGILAAMENGKVASGAEIERCDVCERYLSDTAARNKMASLGLVGDSEKTSLVRKLEAAGIYCFPNDSIETLRGLVRSVELRQERKS